MSNRTTSLSVLVRQIRACRACESELPLGPRPVLAVNQESRILIVGQAPGIRVHRSGIPWDDPSGTRLRNWLGMEPDEFYDTSKVSIVPMGFCYPGSGSSGDLPPRPECRRFWHDDLICRLTRVKLTIVIGKYAQEFCLGARRKSNLTETVRAWKNYTPEFLPLPHPSPRNNRWLAKNPWFEKDVLPWLKRRVRKAIPNS